MPSSHTPGQIFRVRNKNHQNYADMKHFKLQKRNWLWFAVAALALLLMGCRAARTGMMPNPPTVAEAEARLLQATEQLLTLPADADAETRQKYRQLFEAALAEYLIATRGSTPARLEFEREGKRYTLPVEIIASNRLTDPTRMDTMVIRGDAVRGGFRGEILDLAWLDSPKGPRRLLILFADSLMVFPWEGEPAGEVQVYRFPEEKRRPIRSAYPLGLFFAGQFDADPAPEIALLTSALQEGIVVEYRDGDWQLQPAPPSGEHAFLPIAWGIPSGKNEFRPAGGQVPLSRPLRSFRILPDGRIATLDETGRLGLFVAAPFQQLWQSERPWGSRIFVIDAGQIAVSNEELPAFVIFDYENQRFTPAGLTRNFAGRVSAVTGVEQQTEKGYLVSIVESGPDGVPRSRLIFVGAARVGQRNPAQFPIPRFPNDYAELAVVEELHRRISEFDPEIPENVAANVYEGLYKIGNDNTPAPLLVEQVQTDTSFRRWQITLRSGIRFSDGTLLTAAGVVESWKHLWRSDPLSRTAQRWLWQDIRDAAEYAEGRRNSIRGLQAVDDRTLVIELARARPDFREHLAQSCFAIQRRVPGAPAPLGTGPYHITKMQGNRITCERNLAYHGGRPLLAKIFFTRLNGNIADALLNRQLPVALVQERKDVDFFERVYKRKLLDFPQKAVYFLALNPNSPALNNRTARLEIAAALERKVQADIITEGHCEAASTLAAATKGFTARSNGTANIETPLQIIYRETDGVARQIAERLAARLGQKEIPAAPPRGVNDATFSSLRKSGQYDVLVDAYVPTLGTPLNNLGQLIHRGYILPPAVYQSLNAALTNPTAAAAAGLEMQLMSQHAVLYPLVQLRRYVALPPDLQGVRLVGFTGIDFSKAWRPQ